MNAAAQTNRSPDKVIPPEVLRRWQDMVRRAVASNQPVGPMVQQFAEHAFNRRVAHINTQATRARDLAALQRAIGNEVEKATEFLQSVAKQKTDTLPRPYQGYSFELKGRPDKVKQKNVKMASTPIARASEDHAHKATPIESMYSQRPQLGKYIETLHSQLTAIKTEREALDQAINKGMENRESLVGELTQMAWALYKVAEQIIDEMSPARKRELLPESTMARYKPGMAIPISDEITATMAATGPAPAVPSAVAAAPKQPLDRSIELAMNPATQNVQVLQSAIFNLAADRAKSIMSTTVELVVPASKAASNWMSVVGHGLGQLGTVMHAGWREVLRRVFNVLAKPRTP